MKKTDKFVLLLLAVLFFTSCKKESNTQSNSSNNNPPPTATTEGKLSVYFTGTSASNITYAQARAIFWKSDNPSVYLNPDSVSMDGYWLDTLQSHTYDKRKEWIGAPPFTISGYYDWYVKGKGSVPLMSINTGSTSITYMDTSYISVSAISKSAGVTISHPPLGGTRIEYQVFGNGGLGSTAKKSVNTVSSGITFSPSELSALTVGNMGYMQITAYDESTQSSQTNVNVLFSTSLMIQKSVKINNWLRQGIRHLSFAVLERNKVK